MSDDDHTSIDRVARALRAPVRASDALDARVMRRVRRLPRHARLTLWARLTTPRSVTITPLSWGVVAVALVLFAVLGAAHVDVAVQPARVVARPAGPPPPQRVQFVLVAPAAKKVAVVGDFNGWDASHAAYQAKRRGGGVWSVTAPVPPGHHRYSFVVDDSVWMADPAAPRSTDTDFGLANSAIVVQAAR